eukprot:m51a1_g1670 hypothetical protein (438) ;mRNA; f:389549-390924
MARPPTPGSVLADAVASIATVTAFLSDWRSAVRRFPADLDTLRRELAVLADSVSQMRGALPAGTTALIIQTLPMMHKRLARMQARRGLATAMACGWRLADLDELRTDLRRVVDAVAAATIPASALLHVASKVALTEAALAPCKPVCGAVEFWKDNIEARQANPLLLVADHRTRPPPFAQHAIAGLEVPTGELVNVAIARTHMFRGEATSRLTWELDMDNSGVVTAPEYARWCVVEERTPLSWLQAWESPKRQRVLWVFDNPANSPPYAQAINFSFQPADSTDHAVSLLKDRPDDYAAIITNMVRLEKRDGEAVAMQHSTAGLELIQRIRKELQLDKPIMILDSDCFKSTLLYDKCIESGATGVVADINAFLNQSALRLDPEGYECPFEYKRPPGVKNREASTVSMLDSAPKHQFAMGRPLPALRRLPTNKPVNKEAH